MKITHKQFRKIIKEEVSRALSLDEIMDRNPYDDAGSGALTREDAITYQDWVDLNQRGEWCTGFSGGSECASPIRQLVSLIDPTGVLSWPDLAAAINDYKEDPSELNGFILVLSAVAVIPVVGNASRVFSRLGSNSSYLVRALARMISNGIVSIPTKFQNPIRALHRASQGNTLVSVSG